MKCDCECRALLADWDEWHNCRTLYDLQAFWLKHNVPDRSMRGVEAWLAARREAILKGKE